jgi:hypothetical protein
MGNKEPDIKLETHNLTIPYGFVLFGKMFEMPLECVFGYSGDLKSNHVLEIKSLSGTDDDGLLYDMLYLVEDEEDFLTRHIISSILNNYSVWDVETEVGSWWDNHNRGIKSPS